MQNAIDHANDVISQSKKSSTVASIRSKISVEQSNPSMRIPAASAGDIKSRKSTSIFNGQNAVKAHDLESLVASSRGK